MATDPVDRQLDCFNRQDLPGFLACYAPDAVLAEVSGKVIASGEDEMRSYYQALFDRAPLLRVGLGGRLLQGGFIVDLELGRGHPTLGTFESLVIYSVSDGRIDRVLFAR